MPSLETYHRDLDYSYAPGMFPAMEALQKRPDLVRRLLIHSKLSASPALDALLATAKEHNIRLEVADRALQRIAGKQNVYAAAVFDKEYPKLNASTNHLVLHMPSDMGNLGTILRSALGFGYLDVAIVGPAADYYDPQVVRASMGAVFSLRVNTFESMEAYIGEHGGHALYLLMLQASIPLESVCTHAQTPHALVLGNEGSGLPDDFAALGQAVRIPHSNSIDSLNLGVAASIAMYRFFSSTA